MATRPSSFESVVLWLRWDGYFVDEFSETPSVCLKNHQVFDLNTAAWIKGVMLGMRMHQLRGLVPDCVYVEHRSDVERRNRWLDVCAEYSSAVEVISETCAAVDLSAHPQPYQVARDVTAHLHEMRLGKLVSGAGPCKWLAQVSADLGRPLTPLNVAEFLHPLPVTKLAPVDVADRERLHFLGYKSVGAVACLSLEALTVAFGKRAIRISQAAKGMVRDRVQSNYPPDQVAVERHFSSPVQDFEQVRLVLKQLSTALVSKLDGRQATQIELIWTDDDGCEHSRTRAYKRPIVDVSSVIASAGSLLLDEGCTGFTRLAMRLGKVEPIQLQQIDTFSLANRQNPEERTRVLNDAFSSASIIKAANIQTSRREQVLQLWKKATGWS
jgi:hypothetical protein